MTFTEAMEIIDVIEQERGEGVLETLHYMDRNLFQFEETQRNAFRIVTDDFSQVLRLIISRLNSKGE